MNFKTIILTALSMLAAQAPAFAADPASNAPATNGVVVSVVSVPAVASNAPATNATNTTDVTVISETPITPTNEVTMNFHEAPLNTILQYLSKRMGFVIATDVTSFHDAATIISEQPVNKEEVIALLSDALHKNGYSVTHNG